ncbi:hypothetical protein HZB04_01490 [Candidatus Wolfebacteria bacterium]|nr:hypothetical protein [Candidatus Wolfebacteria bacterium]
MEINQKQKNLTAAFVIGAAVGLAGTAALKRIDKDKKIKNRADKLSAEIDKARKRLEEKILEKKPRLNFIE